MKLTTAHVTNILGGMFGMQQQTSENKERRKAGANFTKILQAAFLYLVCVYNFFDKRTLTQKLPVKY
jgi:hypothetical protein